MLPATKYQDFSVFTCNAYMSLWQKVHPLNPGMFVYSYLFSSYYSYLHETVVAFIQYALMSS